MALNSRQPAKRPQPSPVRPVGSRSAAAKAVAAGGGELADAVRSSPFVVAQRQSFTGALGDALQRREGPVQEDRPAGANQSITGNWAKSGGIAQRTAVVQMVRTVIGPAGTAQAITLAALQAMLVAIDVELAALEPGETELGILDLGRVTGWRNTADQRLNALAGLNPGAAAYTWDQIQTQANPMLQAFRQAIVPLSNARLALNKSKAEHEEYVAEMRASEEQLKGYKDKERLEGYKDKEKKAEKPKEPEETWEVGKYDKGLGGAIVLVEEPFVVVIEHYQLKHNADLGVLAAGGPFTGETGSQLLGGWRAHVDTYAPEVLAFAKQEAAKHPDPKEGKTVILAKQRTPNIEAYITLVRYKKVWLVHYHGNPPK